MADALEKILGAVENQSIFEIAVKNSPLGIIVTDDSGKIIYVNPKLCAMSGYYSSDLISKNPHHEWWGI